MLLLTAALALAGGLTAAAVGRLPGDPALPGLPAVVALAVALAVAATLYVELRAGRQRDLLDLTEAALAPALVLLPAVVVVPLVAAVKAGVHGARGLSALKTCFNAAQWAAAAAAGSAVLAAGRQPGPFSAEQLPLLVLALLAVAGVNTAATVAVISFAGGGSPRRLLAEDGGAWLRVCALGLVVALASGVASVALWQWAPAAAPLLLVASLVVAHRASRALAAERASESRLLGLQRAHLLLAGDADPRHAVPAFLAELRLAFRRADAALYLTDRSGRCRAAVRPGTPSPGEPPAPEEVRLAEELLTAGRPLRVGTGRRPGPGSVPALLSAAGWRECLAAPVRADGHVLGLLTLRDRDGLEGFEDGELAVLDAAACLLGQALHRGELAAALDAERDALERAEARWRALVQEAPDLLLVTDSSGRVVYASPATARLTGVDADELRGRELAALLRSEDAERARRLVAEVAAVPRGRGEARLCLRAADGSDRHVEVVLSNLLDTPHVGALVVNARDVTERRRVEDLQAGQALVLERVASGAELAETLGLLVKVVEGQQDGAHCGVVLDPPGRGAGSGPGRPRGLSSSAPPLPGRALPALAFLAEPHLPPEALAELRAVVATALPTAVPGVPGAVVDLSGPALAGSTTRLRAAGVGTVGVHVLTSAATDAAELGAGGGALVLCHPDAAAEQAFRLVAETALRLADLAVRSARTRDRLAHQAAHDALTDLPNRTVFLDRLERALTETRRTGRAVLVLFLDLDRFKVVNDSLGHASGDALLRAVAARLRRIVRPGDTVARFGGDEFTVLCEGIRDEEHALELVERIQDALRLPFALDGQELFVTASIGLALGRAPDTDAGTLLENADAAMYRAKERGGTAYEVFDEAMRHRAQRRLGLQNALHRAIEQRQFRVLYQPTVSLRTGTVVGVEALVRWSHPEEGLLPPSVFIPLAEETGLIVPIGFQVLREAVAQAAAWDTGGADGTGPVVSVNLSAAQLKDPDLVPGVRRALEESGVAAERVTLEITESALMDDVDASTAVLAELKALGLRLVIDDFGTGWSSLAYLQRLPVDGLKVDRTFVAGLGESEGDAEIVRAVVALARSLDLVAVAEGVESEAHVRRLVDLDCDVVQGFLFGRPAPPDEVDLRPRSLVGLRTR